MFLFLIGKSSSSSFLVLSGQVKHWQGEVAGVWAEETSGTDVPGDSCRDNTERTSSDLKGLDTSQLGGHEQQEGQVEEEEEQNQSEGASE